MTGQLRSIAIGIVLAALLLFTSNAFSTTDDAATRQILHMLDYIGVDYPGIRAGRQGAR